MEISFVFSDVCKLCKKFYTLLFTINLRYFISTDVSEERIASTSRAEEYTKHAISSKQAAVLVSLSP
jgi:hypothetical protein